jgi:hypothetical protein
VVTLVNSYQSCGKKTAEEGGRYSASRLHGVIAIAMKTEAIAGQALYA